MGIDNWDEFIYNNGHSIMREIFIEISVMLIKAISVARIISVLAIEWMGGIFKKEGDIS